MNMGQSVRCLFWAVLYCVLYLVTASEEELLDFDFGDLKEIDWNYDNDNSHEMLNKGSTTAQENLITFDDDLDLMEDSKIHPYDWREKMLRTALSKALTNKIVRQKFIEVMPILRVLSKQQKLALSALITAQVSAKKGHELRLDQVRMMFGDDKSLILPIVYDIANLVRNSAKKYIEFDYTLADLANFPKKKVSYERRNLDLTSAELAEEDTNEGIGTLPATAKMTQDVGLQDFMADMPDEYLDPMEINKELQILGNEKTNTTATKSIPAVGEVKKTTNGAKQENVEVDVKKTKAEDVIVADPMKINRELQKDVPTLQLITGSAPAVAVVKTTTRVNANLKTTTTTPTPLRRTRRSTENTEFVHKLIRSVPSSVNEVDLQRGLAGRTLKLNTTAFATHKETTLTPSTTPPATEEPAPLQDNNLEPYQLVENIAFASLNGSEISLSDDADTENDAAPDSDDAADEALPTPEELIAGPRYRVSTNKLMNLRPSASMPKGKRVLPKKRARPQLGSGVSPPKKCERFTASMCIRTEDYPMELIMGSIRRHRNAMTALLAEYIDKPYTLDTSDDFEDYVQTKKRRQDNNAVQTGLCQSIVRYARPQKARSASGEWKFIVNTGQHTQTLRLEKCTSPQETCSYLSSSYKSHCSQVYNYHRLLSWDKTRGLHVDIFKVPTCCSCQIDGFKQQQFAAALSSFTKKDFSTAHKSDHYRNDAHDYTDDEEEDDEDFGFSLRNQHHYKHDNSFDANELLLGSNRVRTKVPSPTVGSYLSPPGSEEFEQYPFKLTRDTSSIYKPSSSASSSSSSSSSSGSSSNSFLRDLARRRPHKSFNDYHTDLEYSPSEHHAEREAVATTALRPSPLAPEPFVPSHQSQPTSQQQDDHSLIPMPTKSHHKPPQQTQYQQRSPMMEPHYPNHQYPPQHQPSGPHHYQAITTPMHQEPASKPSQGYAPHTRLHPGSAKRPLQRLPPKRPNTLRRHRSARLYRL